MKRLLAILVFVTGGLATEAAHPIHCLSVAETGVRVKRQKR
jgi:hypothetical protein